MFPVGTRLRIIENPGFVFCYPDDPDENGYNFQEDDVIEVSEEMLLEGMTRLKLISIPPVDLYFEINLLNDAIEDGWAKLVEPLENDL